MNRDLSYVITEGNITIEHFLKSMGYTHSVIVTLKKTKNGIMQNHKWARTCDMLSDGDLLQIHFVEPTEDTTILPIPGPLNIIYEDEDILVIDKPYGMPIHPSINHYENTLANAVLAYYEKGNGHFTFRCINRLDRDTTGLTIVAKNMLSAGILNVQMKNRMIHRTYYAICQGEVDEKGTIQAKIGRSADSTVIRIIDEEHGETAITHYWKIAYDSQKDLSLIKLQLETGRTHQIRVHMKSIGHPLIGDFLYNPDYTFINRQALHSGELDFVHPITKEKMHLSSGLPQEMKCIFESN